VTEQNEYPVAIIDREEVDGGVYVINSDEEMRAYILDSLSYMREDPEPDSEDAAEYTRMEALDVNALMTEFFESSDEMVIPVYRVDLSAGQPTRGTADDNNDDDWQLDPGND